MPHLHHAALGSFRSVPLTLFSRFHCPCLSAGMAVSTCQRFECHPGRGVLQFSAWTFLYMGRSGISNCDP
jgi:hypothetical protein